MSKKLPKIVVILGPTASGKTALAIKLAKEFNGEIISADSRQIYKKMDIGTAKPKGVWEKTVGSEAYMVDGVPHYLMDIVDPGKNFTLSDFKSRAVEKINDIIARGKVPFLVGGTGLYIWSVIDNLDMPKVEPNKKLRKELEKKNLPELVALLKQLDSENWSKIDLNNPRRVIRALEVSIWTGESFLKHKTKSRPIVKALQIGISWPREELYERINKRIDNQIKEGLVEETKKLVRQKYSRNMPSMSSIGYKQIGGYLRGETSLEEAVEMIKRDSRHYAKRQITWFKRDKRIKWIASNDFSEAHKLIKKFLL